MATRRAPEELKAALDAQRQALFDSCMAFDEGKRWEAMRIAVAVYVLVHDGGKKNKSILTQMGLKDRIKFLASGKYIDGGNLLRDAPLVGMKIYAGGTAEYVAHCATEFSSANRMLSFLEWWERDRVFRDGSFSLTRKKLTYNLRSVQGGAHFDEMVRDPNYLRFSQAQLTTPQAGTAGSLKAILGAELATMRQIGWELIQILDALPKITEGQ
jgi:hypothetical protein